MVRKEEGANPRHWIEAGFGSDGKGCLLRSRACEANQPKPTQAFRHARWQITPRITRSLRNPRRPASFEKHPPAALWGHGLYSPSLTPSSSLLLSFYPPETCLARREVSPGARASFVSRSFPRWERAVCVFSPCPRSHSPNGVTWPNRLTDALPGRRKCKTKRWSSRHTTHQPMLGEGLVLPASVRPCLSPAAVASPKQSSGSVVDSYLNHHAARRPQILGPVARYNELVENAERT